MSIKITATARLARDAELRYTPNGNAVLGFRVASNPRKQNQQTGKWEDVGETTWLSCNVWGEEAEALGNAGTLTKGTLVELVGALYTETFTGRDGQQRSDLKVKVFEVAPKFADGGRPTQQQAQQPDPWATDTAPAF